MHPSLAERAALCDLLDELGPDAPTVPEGWQTRDLAAHLWIREHRPDAAPGLLGRGPFAGHTERLQQRTAQRPFGDVVGELRGGPPRFWPSYWLPGADLAEWFVHHEDVRRANGRGPREDDVLDAALWRSLRGMGRLLARKAEVGIELASHDGRRQRIKKHDRLSVTVTGRPGDLMLVLFDRDADVTVDGPPEALAAWNASDLGV